MELPGIKYINMTPGIFINGSDVVISLIGNGTFDNCYAIITNTQGVQTETGPNICLIPYTYPGINTSIVGRYNVTFYVNSQY